jgi:hypothetical protein
MLMGLGSSDNQTTQVWPDDTGKKTGDYGPGEKRTVDGGPKLPASK